MSSFSGRRLAVAVLSIAGLVGCGPSADEIARAKMELEAAEARRHAVAAAEESLRRAAESKRAIDQVIAADVSAGKAGSASNVARAMRAIDTTRCPTDFRQAYEIHIQAWEDKAKLEQLDNQLNSDSNRRDVLIDAVLSKMFSVQSSAISDHREANQKLDQAKAIVSAKIRDSFNVVRLVALKYGASVN